VKDNTCCFEEPSLLGCHVCWVEIVRDIPKGCIAFIFKVRKWTASLKMVAQHPMKG